MALNRVTQIDDSVPIRNVLISVSDKTGLPSLVAGLRKINPAVRFYSTGGTFAQIQVLLGDEAPGCLHQVSDYTGQPEMQGGLVKTLDFKIYMGLLSETYNQAHRNDLKRTGCIEFDLVVVNLYPFGATVGQSEVTLEDARANIDIGGPTMLRASAKNFLRVASVCDPSDYLWLLEELSAGRGALGLKTRFELAKKTFQHTAAYDTAISGWLSSRSFDPSLPYNFGATP
jgi:phosphoribosylaminoimidazolecarboxamide formyltransferase/IMP cyclohydrolase